MPTLTVGIPPAAVWDVLGDPARWPSFAPVRMAAVEISPESAVVTLSRATITIRVIPAGNGSVIRARVKASSFVSPVLVWRVRRWLHKLAEVAAAGSWFADVEPDDLAG